MGVKKYKILVGILIFSSVFIGSTVVKSMTSKSEKIIVEYYYFNPCRSCTYGEEFKAKLEEEISDIISVDEYEIQINNTSDENSNKKHKNIMSSIDIPEGEAIDLPMIKVGENYIFGVEAIEKNTKAVIQKVKEDKS